MTDVLTGGEVWAQNRADAHGEGPWGDAGRDWEDATEQSTTHNHPKPAGPRRASSPERPEGHGQGPLISNLWAPEPRG